MNVRSTVNFRRYERAHHATWVNTLKAGADRITDWERANHRWQNRTGDAEAGLLCTAHETDQSIRLVNAHGVPYGIFLETRVEGRFKILLEAIRRHWFSILSDGAARCRGLR